MKTKTELFYLQKGENGGNTLILGFAKKGVFLWIPWVLFLKIHHFWACFEHFHGYWDGFSVTISAGFTSRGKAFESENGWISITRIFPSRQNSQKYTEYTEIYGPYNPPSLPSLSPKWLNSQAPITFSRRWIDPKSCRVVLLHFFYGLSKNPGSKDQLQRDPRDTIAPKTMKNPSFGDTGSEYLPKFDFRKILPSAVGRVDPQNLYHFSSQYTTQHYCQKG